MRRYLPIIVRVRRKADTLLPIEESILAAGIASLRLGTDFHGFAIAKAIQEDRAAKRLTAHGTLYKALARLEARGLLTSTWEDPDIAAGEQRPRRRLYRVTPLGEQALAQARQRARAAPGLLRRPGVAGS